MSAPPEHDCRATDELVCPYCGKEQSDSWEIRGDSGDIECGHCGRTFQYERYVSVTYNTTPIIGPQRLDEFWQQQELEALKDD